MERVYLSDIKKAIENRYGKKCRFIQNSEAKVIKSDGEIIDSNGQCISIIFKDSNIGKTVSFYQMGTREKFVICMKDDDILEGVSPLVTFWSNEITVTENGTYIDNQEMIDTLRQHGLQI